MIRSYFYSRLDSNDTKQRPNGWPSFIGQFCSYGDLHRAAGRESLRRTLCEEFGFLFEEEEETHKDIDPEELEKLAATIFKLREAAGHKKEKGELLARNDALHVLRVYAKRRELKEDHVPNPYGYKTWWLTSATLVLQATRELVRDKGSKYMIRPEFLLNFIALNPSLEEVRQAFETIFPSLLGVKLSNRMRDDVFKSVVSKIKEVSQFGDGRARALVAELSDKLKGDHYIQYQSEFGRKSGRKERASVAK